MKILLTTDTYYPMINGVVISTNNLYKELKAQGHDVRIMTLSNDGKERFEEDIYYLRSLKVKIYPNARIKMPFLGELVKQIEEWKPDIIHSQTEFTTMIVVKQLVKKLNVPNVHTYHTMYEDYLKYFLKGKVIKKNTAARLTKLLLNTFDGVIVPTEKVEEVLKSYDVTSDTYIVPTGIDLSKFQKDVSEEEIMDLKLKHNLEDKDKVLVYVGRIAEEKNIDEIIRLFKNIVNEKDDVKLLIVGGGPGVGKLEELANNLGISDKICFTGMVKPEDVYKYYKLGDVFVTASTSETQGLTYVEALASGCPIVCRWDKCIDGVILDGKNGFVYKKSGEFYRSIIKILENESIRKEMSKEALKTAEEYSCNMFGNKVLDVYMQIFNKKKKNELVG